MNKILAVREKIYDHIRNFSKSGWHAMCSLVAGETLQGMTPEDCETCVWVVCNSCLNLPDVQTFAPETT